MFFAHRTFKRLRKGRSSKMHQKKWTQPCPDGCAHSLRLLHCRDPYFQPFQGSWGGTGTKKAPAKPFLVKKVSGVDRHSRQDYGKAHLIVSEKRDKKAARYMVKDLPYPYTSKAQYERSLQTPIGTEWNTRLGFQRGTLPRVTKKVHFLVPFHFCDFTVLTAFIARFCY